LENIFFTSNLFLAIKHNETLMDSDSLWDLYIDEFGNNPPIEITWDLNHLKSCDVIVAATNQGAPFLESKHFKNGAFICDISIPSNCRKELLENKNMTVIHGGLVSLPNNESLHLKGLPLKKGQAFACMSETILMGFEQSEKSFSFGELLISQVNEIGKIGHKHGFK
jgi:predicted amino acid dehydrogenase